MTQKQLELLRFVSQILLDNEAALIDLGATSKGDFQDLKEHLSSVEKEAFSLGLDL